MIQRLADKKMNMLRHHNLSENLEAIPAASEFERIKKIVSVVGGREVGFSAVTTEGDKVVVAFMLIALEAQRHAEILSGFWDG